MRKQPENPLHTRMRIIFFDWYRANFGIEPSWAGAQGKTLNLIWKNILRLFTNKNIEATDDAVLATWQKMLDSIKTNQQHQWLYNNLTIQLIYSKFDVIVSKLVINNGAGSYDKMKSDILNKLSRYEK